MAAFGAVAIGATGLGPVVMAWVEANTKLEWRWIQWIQYSEPYPPWSLLPCFP